MAKQDYYDVLGVSRDADDDALKKAFRKAAMQHHPDRNPDDESAEAKFKEVNEAYAILKDPDKRAAYNQMGHAAFENGTAPGATGGFEFTGNFSDIFDDLFGEFTGRGRQGAGQGRGGGRRRRQDTRGADLRYNMSISLNEAFAGKKATVQIPTSQACEACEGSGASAGSKPAVCGTCNGAGRVRAQQGFFTVERTCHECGGQGQVIRNPCVDCNGQGRVAKERTLQVNIPAGVDDGNRIRLTGEGEAGIRGGGQGDLYIFITVEPHDLFTRDGIDIYVRAPIPMATAALGGHIDVPTLGGGKARLTIPAGTQSGRQFRMRKKGMPVMQSSAFGDLYVQTVVETPSKLTKRQKELLEEFEEAGTKHSPQSDSFSARAEAVSDEAAE